MHALQEISMTRRRALQAAGVGLTKVNNPVEAARYLSSVVGTPFIGAVNVDGFLDAHTSTIKLFDTARAMLKDSGVQLAYDREGGTPRARHVFELGDLADTIGVDLSGFIEDEEGRYQELSIDYMLNGDPRRTINVLANSRWPFVSRFNAFLPDIEIPDTPDEPEYFSQADFYEAIDSIGNGYVHTGVLRQAGVEASLYGRASTYHDKVRRMFDVDSIQAFHDGLTELAYRVNLGARVPVQHLRTISDAAEANRMLSRRGDLFRALGRNVAAALEPVLSDKSEEDLLTESATESDLPEPGVSQTVFDSSTDQTISEIPDRLDVTEDDSTVLEATNREEVKSPKKIARIPWRSKAWKNR